MNTALTIFSVCGGLVAIFVAVYLFFAGKKERENLLKRYNQNSKYLNYREDLLGKMRENFEAHTITAKNAVNFGDSTFATEYIKKMSEMWDTWEAVKFEDMVDTGLPVEHFYTPEILNKLLWQFEPRTPKQNTRIH